MIRFNSKPGFFQSWPIVGWDGMKPTRDRVQHLKVVVDVTFDKEAREAVTDVARAFQELFNQKDIIGPDGHPMKLGKFAKFDVPALKAGVPNANGDIYPEDVVMRSNAYLDVAQEKPVSMSSAPKNKSRRLYWVLLGGVGLLVLEAVLAVSLKGTILELVVDNVCRYW